MCPDVIIVVNMLEHLADTDRLRSLLAVAPPKQWQDIVRHTISFVVDPNRFSDNMEKQFPGVTLPLSTPPGYNY